MTKRRCNHFTNMSLLPPTTTPPRNRHHLTSPARATPSHPPPPPHTHTQPASFPTHEEHLEGNLFISATGGEQLKGQGPLFVDKTAAAPRVECCHGVFSLGQTSRPRPPSPLLRPLPHPHPATGVEDGRPTLGVDSGVDFFLSLSCLVAVRARIRLGEKSREISCYERSWSANTSEKRRPKCGRSLFEHACQQ